MKVEHFHPADRSPKVNVVTPEKRRRARPQECCPCADRYPVGAATATVTRRTRLLTPIRLDINQKKKKCLYTRVHIKIRLLLFHYYYYCIGPILFSTTKTRKKNNNKRLLKKIETVRNNIRDVFFIISLSIRDVR